jgi:hypothetical protein
MNAKTVSLGWLLFDALVRSEAILAAPGSGTTAEVPF